MEEMIILESMIGPQITGIDCDTGDRVIAVVTRDRASELEAMLEDAETQRQQASDTDVIDEDFTPILTRSDFFRKEV